jgi:cyclopropane fatty-acyl-phospholipid synthase-like methyltransferase
VADISHTGYQIKDYFHVLNRPVVKQALAEMILQKSKSLRAKATRSNRFQIVINTHVFPHPKTTRPMVILKN